MFLYLHCAKSEFYLPAAYTAWCEYDEVLMAAVHVEGEYQMRHQHEN